MIIADFSMIAGVSFWLSFLAFVAVITGKSKGIFKDLLSTVWVSLWITPVMAMSFGKISLISPITNMLVMFLVETVTIIGGIGVFLGLVWPVLGKIGLMLVFPLLKYFIVVTEWMGGWRWASVEVKFNWLILVGWYMILGYFLIKRKEDEIRS